MEDNSYENKYLIDVDFSKKDISNVIFKNCNFKNVRFKDAVINNTQFLACTVVEGVTFEGANMSHCVIKQCNFKNVNFKNADLSSSVVYNTEFSGSSFLGVKFDKSILNGVDVTLCNLHLASFVDTQIMSIDFIPTRRIPYMRGINFFKKGEIYQNTIFISGNNHLDFTDYCMYELRKDRFFAGVNKAHFLLRPFAIILLFLYGLLTDFGQSFTRWILCSIVLIAVFTILPLFWGITDLNTLLLSSLLAFFGFGEIPTGYSYFYVLESIIGYFMLGSLISLLTNKLYIS